MCILSDASPNAYAQFTLNTVDQPKPDLNSIHSMDIIHSGLQMGSAGCCSSEGVYVPQGIRTSEIASGAF